MVILLYLYFEGNHTGFVVPYSTVYLPMLSFLVYAFIFFKKSTGEMKGKNTFSVKMVTQNDFSSLILSEA